MNPPTPHKPRSTSSSPDHPAEDADEGQSDAGRDQQVQLEHEEPAQVGERYEGAVVVEETSRPWLNSSR